MKIGIDVRLWSQTGVGRYIDNLTTEISKIDNINNYFLFARKEDASKIRAKIAAKNFKIIEADVAWHSFSEQIKFPGILNKQQLDLMHFPYFSVPIFYKGSYILTIHDLIIDHYPTGNASTLFLPLYFFKLLFYKLVVKVSAIKAKKIIVPSNATKNEVIDHLKIDKEKILVTYEAADKSIKSGKVVNEPEINNYFLYVGNAYPHKNLKNLILGFSKLIKEFPDLKLVLVGKTDHFYLKLKDFVNENKLEKNVIFFGKANDSELFNLYKNALSLVSASLMEGFGLPVLESLSMKCLVVCSNIPSFTEIAQDCAIYFNPKNTEDIYEKLKKVYLKDYDKNIIEKGYNHSLEFSWKKAAQQTLNVYESSSSL